MRTPEESAQLEFDVITHHVKRDKAAFIARLKKHTRQEGDCVVWTGNKDSSGYPRMSFRIPNAPREKSHIKIRVHRIAVILTTGAPIPSGHQAGHYECFNPLCIRHVKAQPKEENLADRTWPARRFQNGKDGRATEAASS